MQSRPHHLLIRLNWLNHCLGDDSDGLICLDTDGWVTGANPAARQMVAQFNSDNPAPVHGSELFAMPYEMLFDAANGDATGFQTSVEVPLWSGLRLHALALRQGQHALPQQLSGRTPQAARLPLKDLETALIRKAVTEARGNVVQAARTLGVSRATVYRRLGSGRGR